MSNHAEVIVGDYQQKHSFPITAGRVGESVTITTEDQYYRVVLKDDGSLEISSQHFTNTTLNIRPVVSNVINVKGVHHE